MANEESKDAPQTPKKVLAERSSAVNANNIAMNVAWIRKQSAVFYYEDIISFTCMYLASTFAVTNIVVFNAARNIGTNIDIGSSS